MLCREATGHDHRQARQARAAATRSPRRVSLAGPGFRTAATGSLASPATVAGVAGRRRAVGPARQDRRSPRGRAARAGRPAPRRRTVFPSLQPVLEIVHQRIAGIGCPRHCQSTVRSLSSTANEHPVVDAPDRAVRRRQQVSALAVAVVDQGVEDRDPPQRSVVALHQGDEVNTLVDVHPDLHHAGTDRAIAPDRRRDDRPPQGLGDDDRRPPLADSGCRPGSPRADVHRREACRSPAEARPCRSSPPPASATGADRAGFRSRRPRAARRSRARRWPGRRG